MEFEIKGVKYRVAKLSVFDQLKVTRKLLPVLAGMMSDFGSIRSRLPADGKIDTVKFEQLKPVFETMLPRIAEELSSLTEDDTDAIIHPCLAVVSRRHMDGWVPVFTRGELMFDDMTCWSCCSWWRGWSPIRWEIFLPTPLTSTTQSLQQG